MPIPFFRCLVMLVAVCFLMSGCRKQPRTPEEILKERNALPALFLTQETNQRVIAPGTTVMFGDPKLGEVCWRAKECTNPHCPGRKGEEPVLFIMVVDSGYYVSPEGHLLHDGAKSKTALHQGCPHCMKQRNPAEETPQQQARYTLFIRDYELPETEARRKVLDAELKKAMEPVPDKK